MLKKKRYFPLTGAYRTIHDAEEPWMTPIRSLASDVLVHESKYMIAKSPASLREIIERDFRTRTTATEASLERMRRVANRYRGSVRLSTCRIWTEEAYAERKARELAIRLP